MWHDVEQNSDDWDVLRCDVITMSNLAKIMANYGAAFGAPARKYAARIALGQLTGEVQTGGYSNTHMERGHEQEPMAVLEYEARYFTKVTNGGFYKVGDQGGSPDGLVGKPGMIEVKSAISDIHYDRIRRQSFDPSHKWQCLGNLKISDRDWLDFISYCIDYPEGKRIFVYRFHAKDYADEFEMIDLRIEKFRALIIEAKEIILNSKYSIVEALKL